jgi:hypothetical protein
VLTCWAPRSRTGEFRVVVVVLVVVAVVLCVGDLLVPRSLPGKLHSLDWLYVWVGVGDDHLRTAAAVVAVVVVIAVAVV